MRWNWPPLRSCEAKARFNLGASYDLMGDREAATREYRRLLELPENQLVVPALPAPRGSRSVDLRPYLQSLISIPYRGGAVEAFRMGRRPGEHTFEPKGEQWRASDDGGEEVQMIRRLATAPLLTLAVASTVTVLVSASRPTQPSVPSVREAVHIPSTADGSLQKSYLVVPPSLPKGPRPVLVVLHAWSATNEGRWPSIEADAAERGWLVLAPNFRGPSDHPEGCGSPVARQDILDAVAFVRARYTVDQHRVYVMGYSGGGFMTLMMAARHPEVWAGASAWAGITDLAAWYAETPHDDIRGQLRGCFGGAPDTADLKGNYLERSPISYLRPSLSVPIDIAHGDHDPQVAVSHALNAFDLLAPGAVSRTEREHLSSRRGAPSGETDLLIKPAILLRRVAGAFRLTVYDGGHDYYPRAGMAWLAEQRRP